MNALLDGLSEIGGGRSRRVSSWDTRGGNRDYIVLRPGETTTLAQIEGPGRIAHMYCIVIDPSFLSYRRMVLRIWWDGESTPSVEVPLGDFFCVSHCLPRPVQSLLVTVNPGNAGDWCPVSYGLNCYFPMPFARGARITLEHEGGERGAAYPLMVWYHVDWEQAEEPPRSTSRFHAQWRRESLTQARDPAARNVPLWDGANLDGRHNFRILEARGRGKLVGLHLQVDNAAGGWYGEGDDMVFIDGEGWPPTIHGTGTEEIFGGGACPSGEYSGPYTGFHLVERPTFAGRNGMYRWYLHDPLLFTRSIDFSIEHGHANNFENDYASVAYWYQGEPHAAFPELPAVAARLPRGAERLLEAESAIAQILSFQPALERTHPESDAFGLVWKFVNDGARALRDGRIEDAMGAYRGNIAFLRAHVG